MLEDSPVFNSLKTSPPIAKENNEIGPVVETNNIKESADKEEKSADFLNDQLNGGDLLATPLRKLELAGTKRNTNNKPQPNSKQPSPKRDQIKIVKDFPDKFIPDEYLQQTAEVLLCFWAVYCLVLRNF